MIIDIILYILGQFIHFVAYLLPTWEVWPDTLLYGLTYFFNAVANFNFIVPVDSLFTVILFIINFEVAWFGAKLLMKLFNFIRGTGSGLDI
jgi:hypothetical protein